MKIDQTLISALIGFITGVLGTFFAPWVKWGIEKRKLKHKNRKKLIEDLERLATEDEFDRFEIINTSQYQAIRNELSPDAVKEFERRGTFIIADSSDSIIVHDKRAFLKEINRIATKWGIY